MDRRLPLLLLLSLVVAGAPTPAAADGPPVVLVAETDRGVVQLDPTTGAVVRLLVPGGKQPAVSPDGGRLVFGLRDGAAQHLWVSDLTGANRVQLTSGAAVDSAPDWSPDGRRIALCRAAASSPFTHPRIAVANSDASPGAHVVPGTEEGCNPSWSPDSALLAYATSEGIRITDPEGRTNEPLVAFGASPDWSPDGQTIAVTHAGSESDISLVQFASGDSKVITEFEGYHALWQEPVWAPDGTSLYTSMYTESFPDEHNQTHVGWGIEHRGIDGSRGSFWADRALTPSLGGGPAPARDTVPPPPVAATATAAVNAIDVEVSPQGESDAAGAVVRYAAGDVAPVGPDDGMPGGRTVRGHLRIRHLLADTTYSISVFPVDWSGNIGPRSMTMARTPHEVATTLRTSGVRDFISYGESLVAGATLTREDTGGPVAGATVQLFGQLHGQPERLLATLTTDANGAVSSRRLPSGETRYTFRYGGQDPMQPATADALTQVRTVVRTELSRSVAPRGSRVLARVRLVPTMVGRKVYVEQRLNGSVRRRTTLVSDANGTVTLSLYTGSRATYSITAFTYGDGLRMYGVSPARRLTLS
ncbi:MAG: hypothetical protein QOI82_966 [Actinomycetota bacterium]|jgi:hypothetical protein|nr:hypothetical protein [Actinomycetota bacterium]